MTSDTAQILANCLDALEQPGVTVERCVAPYLDQHESLSELVNLAQTLRSAPMVTPSLDFRLDARQRLLMRLPPRRSRRTRLVGRLRTWSQHFVGHTRLLWRTAFILLAGIVFGASVVVASAQSLPNDVLYPVKRTIEQARLTLAVDNAASSELRLTFAAERLNEVQRLIDRGRGDDVSSAIEDFAAQMRSVVAVTQSMPNTAERTSLWAHIAESMESADAVLARMQDRLPASVQVDVKRARAVLAEQLNEPQDLQPITLPLIAPVKPPDRTATTSPTPAPSRTWAIIPRGTLHWLPPSPEHHPVHPPIVQATVLPTRQAPAMPPQWLYNQTPVSPTILTQIPFAFPTYRAPSHPTIIPPARPTPPWPPFPTPLPHSDRSRSSGGHH